MYQVIIADRMYKDTVSMFFQSFERAVDMMQCVDDSNKYFLAGPVEMVNYEEARDIAASRSAKQMTMCNELADMFQEYLEDMVNA